MCREEFRLRNFKLWHPILRDFTHSRVSSNIDLWSPRWLFIKQLHKIWCSGQEWVILHGTWVCANLFGCMTDLLINSGLLALFAIVKRPAKKVYLHLPIYHWQQITKLYCEVYEIIQRRKRRLKDGIWSGVVGVPKKWPPFQPQFWARIAMSKFLVAWKQNWFLQVVWVEVSVCICHKCVCLGFYYTPDVSLVKNAWLWRFLIIS